MTTNAPTFPLSPSHPTNPGKPQKLKKIDKLTIIIWNPNRLYGKMDGFNLFIAKKNQTFAESPN